MPKKIELSVIEHHETVRHKLNKAVEDGEITKKDAEGLYDDWLKRRNESAAKSKKAGKEAAKGDCE